MLSIEEIKLLIEKLEKVEENDLNKIVKQNLDILKELAITVDANNNEMINRLDKTINWFKLDNDKKKINPIVDPLTKNAITKKIYQFAKTNLYNCLEIGPGNGMFSMDFRAWRLNYFIDVLRVEKHIRSMFPGPHQKYLKFYTTERTGCHDIPSNSCNLVFSWDTFVFMTQQHIKEYLQEIHRVLIPGGYCFIQYADCHYDFDLKEASRGYWNYNTKTAMAEIIADAGFREIEMNQFKPGANYAIFQKPGKQNPVVYKVSEITLD
jgi:SAM-dependent methyltransferase